MARCVCDLPFFCLCCAPDGLETVTVYRGRGAAHARTPCDGHEPAPHPGGGGNLQGSLQVLTIEASRQILVQSCSELSTSAALLASSFWRLCPARHLTRGPGLARFSGYHGAFRAAVVIGPRWFTRRPGWKQGLERFAQALGSHGQSVSLALPFHASRRPEPPNEYAPADHRPQEEPEEARPRVRRSRPCR